ncbi:CPA1 family monovalent cation:H+ antiporter [Peribacillus deserti]|uniref:CPA1 family monovalent cation:H+ antiporter n=1 Tax=Peribacillus deserti TaxID=673318 RepID=A0ABS2QJZ5_9BACI|nr:Na+/H+ antiporter [Peribacillus deserti]MBM7693497.1 CPA1 family monovalent cation:H+ antiporter [Peribacillus deserti]
MDLLMTVLLLLICLLISNIISHYIPTIPNALIQIAFGIIAAIVFKDISIEIETEWFLLLFVAPLLYNDGRHFPREELWKMRAPIFGNAIVLVLLTTIGGGYFIHWLISDIPLAASFALAAILSPTDPVAVNGIAKRIRIPEKVLHLVRGESLINDASGLVAFNYAVAAVVTGYFSLREAIFDFTYMFIAGALLGLVLGLLITWIRFTLRKQGINDVTFHSLLRIMTPFVIFMITEELLHASGVIAVVVAGIVHALVKERTETIIAEEQVLTENIWSIVLFILNGIVFLLLGVNIPSSMAETVENPNIGNWLAIGYVIAIGFAILGIRFIWSYFFSFYENRSGQEKAAAKPNIKTTLLISLTGVRGAVTMAGVLSIPYLLKNGDVFPERSLILFLAAGVILFTLLAATMLLPLLSEESAEGETTNLISVNEAKQRLLLSAIKKLRLEMNEENESTAYELINEYKVRFQQIKPELDSKQYDTSHYLQKMKEIRLMALKAERKYIHAEMNKDAMDQAMFESFERSLDYREEALSYNVQSGIIYLIGKMIRGWKRYRGHYPIERATTIAKLRIGQDIQLKALKAALKSLREYEKEHQQRAEMVHVVVLDYKRMINRLKRPTVRYNEKKEEQKEELRLKVMDVERSEIRRMFESGEINRDQAKELRRFVNYHESVALYEHVE